MLWLNAAREIKPCKPVGHSDGVNALTKHNYIFNILLNLLFDLFLGGAGLTGVRLDWSAALLFVCFVFI